MKNILLNNDFNIYLIYFIIGGLLITTTYYFSKIKNNKFCALIPALPIVGLFGLLVTKINNNSCLEYLLYIIKFIIITLILYLIIYLLLIKTNNFRLSIFLGILIWLTILYIII